MNGYVVPDDLLLSSSDLVVICNTSALSLVSLPDLCDVSIISVVFKPNLMNSVLLLKVLTINSSIHGGPVFVALVLVYIERYKRQNLANQYPWFPSVEVTDQDSQPFGHNTLDEPSLVI